MQIIGELRDKKMVDEIIHELTQKKIRAGYQYIKDQDIYLIVVEDDEHASLAHDLYRLKLGLRKPVEIDEQWVKIKTLPRGEFTYATIIFCILLYLSSFSNFGENIYHALFMGGIESSPFYEIGRGQIWRLITPIFLHMSFLHITFNMLWLKDMGYLMEYNFKKNFLIVFVLMSALCSNVGQYLVSGPQFGGMSGVLYAMLGFLWVYKKLHPEFEYAVPKTDMTMMIIWFFACLTGWLGPIANTAHGAGLFAGMAGAVCYQFKFNKQRLFYLFLALFFLVFTLLVEGYKLGGRYYFLLWKQ